jgi:hypothetical protein
MVIFALLLFVGSLCMSIAEAIIERDWPLAAGA